MPYIPIYISSGSNTPISYIPLPFHGFASYLHEGFLIGALIKANFFFDPFFHDKEYITNLKQRFPAIERVIQMNTSQNIFPAQISDFVNNCRKYMEKSQLDHIPPESILEIISKLGSFEYLDIINNYLDRIMSEHKRMHDIGIHYIHQFVTPEVLQHRFHNFEGRKINESKYQDFLENICLNKIGTNMGFPLINNLNDLNKLINEQHSSVFVKLLRNDKFDELFFYLQDFIIKQENIPEELIRRLYPRSINQKPLNIDKIKHNLQRMREHKRNQILYSLRIDDIFEILITGNCTDLMGK